METSTRKTSQGSAGTSGDAGEDGLRNRVAAVTGLRCVPEDICGRNFQRRFGNARARLDDDGVAGGFHQRAADGLPTGALHADRGPWRQLLARTQRGRLDRRTRCVLAGMPMRPPLALARPAGRSAWRTRTPQQFGENSATRSSHRTLRRTSHVLEIEPETNPRQHVVDAVAGEAPHADVGAEEGALRDIGLESRSHVRPECRVERIGPSVLAGSITPPPGRVGSKKSTIAWYWWVRVSKSSVTPTATWG